MWCRHVRNQLSAFTDGELSPPLTRAVAEHLTRCEQCAQEHVRLQELTSLTSAIPLEETPSSLHAGIMMRLAHARTEPAPQAPRPEGRRALLTLAPWVLGAAVTGATAALALTLTQQPSHKGPGTSRVARDSQPGRSAPHLGTPAPRPEGGEATRRVAIAAPPVRKEAPATEEPARVAEEPAAPAANPEEKPAPRIVVVAAGSRIKAATAPRAASATPVKPQPVTATGTDGKPVVEQRNAEPSTPYPTTVAGMMGATTGEMPGTNMVPGTIAETVGMEKETSSRMMAGAGAVTEGEVLGDENEGERGLRMFFEERNRNIPQPPLVMPERNRMRKSL